MRPGRTVGGVAIALLLGASGCGDGKTAARTDVPEPAVAGAAASQLPGTLLALTGAEPEGLALDTRTGVLAVAVRNPDGVALVDLATPSVRKRIPLGGAARHLELARPGGPVLVPSEGNDRLYEISLPDGGLVADIGVGRQPHDVAPAAGGVIFVGDELADTVHAVSPDGRSQVLPAPVQPGGLAATPDGSIVVVVGVRGRRIEAYTGDGRSLGSAPSGVGPTHVRAGADGLFYVADTQGGAVLVFQADQKGVREVGRVSTGGGAPYGLAVDAGRRRLYVTLTGKNELRSYRIDGRGLASDRSWSTVRQPNDVIVEETTGRVVVAGTGDGVLQFIQP